MNDPSPSPVLPTGPQPVNAAQAPPLMVLPVSPVRRGYFPWRVLLSLLLFGSLALNCLLLALVPGCNPSRDGPGLVEERLHVGKAGTRDKIAVVRIEGVILEGALGFVHKQLDQAAMDKDVKAVVVRINSPGGSITASDDLHRRIAELRHGNPAKDRAPKPVVVSMGSMAASGGYYIAMPAEQILAERTTLTGSIGVYAAFPNVAELAEKYGVRLDVIKAGEVKDSGSMFHKMTPAERQLWQDMVDHAYAQFLAVVEEGRPQLKGKLREVVSREMITAEGPEGKPIQVEYLRRRADGGIFTAAKALEYGLVDAIGYLDQAIDAARQRAGLSEDCKVIQYEKPLTFLSLLGVDVKQTGRLDSQRLAEGALPRLWYLTPEAELAGILAALGRE